MTNSIKSPNISYSTDTQDDLEQQVNSTFDNLIDLINERRQVLLDRLQFLKKQPQMIQDSLQQLEDSKIIFMKNLNDTSSNQAKMAKDLDKKISQFRLSSSELTSLNLTFSYDGKEIETAIKRVGSIVDTPVRYLVKSNKPLKSIVGNGVISYPTGMIADESAKVILIADTLQNCICIVDMDGEVIQKFGDSILHHPYDVTLGSNGEVYVSELRIGYVHKFKFQSDSTYKGAVKHIAKTENASNCLASLTYDLESNSLFAAEPLDHRVCVFNQELEFISTFPQLGILQFPQCVSVKNDNVYILDYGNPCMHIFSKSTKQQLKSIIARGFELTLSAAAFFCLGLDDNFLISDYISGGIKVYSTTGHLLHSFGSTKQIHTPLGIQCLGDGTILVVSSNLQGQVHFF